MDLKTHNEIVDIEFEHEIKSKYPEKLDNFILSKKTTEWIYCTFWIDGLINGKSPCMRTKSVSSDSQVKYELRDKYKILYSLACKSNHPIILKRVSISLQGVKNI